jgi:hypothetical protein
MSPRGLSADAAPFERDPVGDRQNSVGVMVAQLLEPFRQTRRALRIGFASESDATHDFAQGERAQMDGIRANRSQPSHGLAERAVVVLSAVDYDALIRVFAPTTLRQSVKPQN